MRIIVSENIRIPRCDRDDLWASERKRKLCMENDSTSVQSLEFLHDDTRSTLSCTGHLNMTAKCNVLMLLIIKWSDQKPSYKTH